MKRTLCLASCLLWSIACLELDAGDDELDLDSFATEEQEIIGGTTTTLRPEIGQFFRRGGMCTATLIAPRYAITAAHCLDTSNYQNTTVDPADRFVVWTPSGVRIERGIERYYSFGSHFTEKIWNGLSSDVAIMRLSSAIPAATAEPVPIAQTRVTSSTAWSTMFGYGCTNRDTRVGAGTKRHRSFQGLVSNILCFGDSGGPTMKGEGVHAEPLWAIHSGFSWNLLLGGYHDVLADATYHKKQIEAVMQSWDGEYELGIDRYGADYRYVAAASASTCRNLCADDARCRAWTLFGGTCFLKDAVPGWSPLAGATSGLSPNSGTFLENDYNRPGADYHSFWSSDGNACATTCARDSRCQAFTMGPWTSGQRRCWLKEEAPDPVRNVGLVSSAKRGLDMNSRRSGAVLLHHFDYGTPSPETCQSECAKRGNCASWTYLGPANSRSPQCWLYSSLGSRISSIGYVSGLRGREFR